MSKYKYIIISDIKNDGKQYNNFGKHSDQLVRVLRPTGKKTYRPQRQYYHGHQFMLYRGNVMSVNRGS